MTDMYEDIRSADLMLKIRSLRNEILSVALASGTSDEAAIHAVYQIRVLDRILEIPEEIRRLRNG